MVEGYGIYGSQRSDAEFSGNGSTLKLSAEFVEHEVSAVFVFKSGADNSTVQRLSKGGDLLSGESGSDHWLRDMGFTGQSDQADTALEGEFSSSSPLRRR